MTLAEEVALLLAEPGDDACEVARRHVEQALLDLAASRGDSPRAYCVIVSVEERPAITVRGPEGEIGLAKLPGHSFH